MPARIHTDGSGINGLIRCTDSVLQLPHKEALGKTIVGYARRSPGRFTGEVYRGTTV